MPASNPAQPHPLRWIFLDGPLAGQHSDRPFRSERVSLPRHGGRSSVVYESVGTAQVYGETLRVGRLARGAEG